MPPLVSIIIPTYNYAQYLGQAIESALDQTYSNIEVIVVNDGSTDNSRDIAASYSRKINYIYQENKGLSAARNVGMARAAGKYLVFLDSDDLLAKDVIALSVASLEKADVAPGCISKNEQFINNIGDHPKKNAWNTPESQALDELLFFRNIAPPHAYMIEREKAIDLSFDSTLKACEDYDFWFKYFSKHGAPIRSEGLVYYRRHRTSMSANLNRQYYFDAVVQKRITEYFLKSYETRQPLFGKPLSPQLATQYALAQIGAWLLTLRNAKRVELQLDIDTSTLLQDLCSSIDIGTLILPGAFVYPIKRYTRAYQPALKKYLPALPIISTPSAGAEIPQPFFKKLAADISWLLV